MKCREGVGKISWSINEGSPTTKPMECIWWLSCARLLRAVYCYKN